MPTFYDPVDFTKAETRNLVAQRLPNPPSTPAQGQKYYDTTLLREGIYNGTSWDYVLSDDRPIGNSNFGVAIRGFEPIVTVTASKTLAMSDCGTVQNCTNTSAAVVTIPLNSAVLFPIGAKVIVRKTTSQTVTVAWSAGVTVLNSMGTTLAVTSVTSVMYLRKTDTDTWITFLDLPETAIGTALRTAVDTTSAKSTIGLPNVTNVVLGEPRTTVLQIGASAGSVNTTGTNWTAISTNAGLVNTGGSNWTAIGSNAGHYSVGSNWTAIGCNAAYLCTTGGNGTYIGSSAGFDVTNGPNNTIIGNNTGRGITTGSGNTIVGASVTGLGANLINNVILASGDGQIKFQVDSTGLATLPISPVFSDNSNLVATTAHVKNVLLNSPSITGSTFLGASTVSAAATLSLPTVGLGNVSAQAANTTQVARSCRPIVIASRTTAFTFTTTYTDFIFNNIVRDNSSAYNSTTGIFTAPYAGIYAFSCHVANFASVSSFTLVSLGSTANTESLRLGLAAGTGAFQVPNARQLVFMNSGDTRRFGIQVGGTNAAGSPEASVTSQTSCYMSIEYLGIDT